MLKRRWGRISITLIILTGFVNGANLVTTLASAPLLSPQLSMAAAVSFVGGLAVIILLEYRENRDTQKERDEAASEATENYKPVILADLLRVFCDFISPTQANARACIFLYDKNKKKDELYMYLFYGDFKNKQERSLRFRTQQGVVGLVFWHTGKSVCINLDGLSKEELSRTWRLSQQQITCTLNLKSILAVPLSHPDDYNKLIGVLAIDSRFPPNVSGLAETSMVDKATNFAEQIAKFIPESAYRIKRRPDDISI